jgi:hypothetical protein
MFPRNLTRIILATGFTLELALSAVADIDSPNAAGKPQEPKENRRAIDEARKSDNGLTADQQQLALGFARTQHPDLADLLEKLKERNPKEYTHALTELSRAEQKLQRMAEQNPERYALAIRLWRVESRIRLQLAQLAIDGDGAQDESLKGLLSERRSMRIELLQFDRKKTAERITNLDRQLEQLQRDPEGDVAKELAKLKQTAGNRAKAEKLKRKTPKAGGKPAADQKPKKQVPDKPGEGGKPDSGKDESPQDGKS